MHKLFIILHSIILRCFLRDRYSQRLHFVAKHCSLNIVYDYTAYTHECTVSFLTQRYIYMPSQQWQKMRIYFVAAVVIGYRNYCIVLLLLLLFFLYVVCETSMRCRTHCSTNTQLLNFTAENIYLDESITLLSSAAIIILFTKHTQIRLLFRFCCCCCWDFMLMNLKRFICLDWKNVLKSPIS